MAVKTQADIQLEVAIGDGIRRARLLANMDQATMARRANVSLSAVKGLESGKGTTLLTLLRVLRVLGREDIFEQLHPQGPPRHGRYGGRERQRASSRSRST